MFDAAPITREQGGTEETGVASWSLRDWLYVSALASQRKAWETNPELVTSEATGQKPKAGVFLYDGAGLAPQEVFDIKAGEAFFCTSSLVRPFVKQPGSLIGKIRNIVISLINQKTSASSPFAALEFACSHSEWGKNVVVFGTDRSTIVDVIAGQQKAKGSGYSKEWLQFAAPIAEWVNKTAVDFGITDPDELRVLAGLKLTQEKLRAADDFLDTNLPGHERNVVGAFVSSARQQLYRVKKDSDLMAIFRGEVDSLPIPSELADKMKCTNHKALGCGCCDARANPYDVFGGDIRYSNSIAVLVPKYGEDSKDHPTWANITSSVEQGIPHVFILGHKDCGGVKALVEIYRRGWMMRLVNSLRGRGPGKNVARWLMQGKDVVKEALDFAKDRNMTADQLNLLAAFRIKIQSGRNVAEYAEKQGKETQVSVYFLEIGSRNIMQLPLNQTMEESYQWVMDPSQRQYLLNTPKEDLEGYAADPRRPSSANDNTAGKKNHKWVLAA